MPSSLPSKKSDYSKYSRESFFYFYITLSDEQRAMVSFVKGFKGEPWKEVGSKCFNKFDLEINQILPTKI